MPIGKRGAIWRGVALLLGGLLVSCGTEQEARTVGPPTTTVEQMKEWPEGFEPAGGGFRPVGMPAEAGERVEEASREAPGTQDYFQTLQRR